MKRATLVIMVKEPRAGRVKTRLGRDIGMTAAAWWYRHQLRTLVHRLNDPRWQILLSVTPDKAADSGCFPALPRMAQGPGDLGQRMFRALRTGIGPTVLIGSDIPSVRRHHIAKAFHTLGSAAATIGPSSDGGFWLVGLRHPNQAPQGLFRNVRWSHPETLADTLPTLPLPVMTIDTLSDVDTLEDLLTLENDV